MLDTHQRFRLSPHDALTSRADGNMAHAGRRIWEVTTQVRGRMMNRDEYYMNLALAVRKRANCSGRRVGAVFVKENRIVATGYNGTPEGIRNCLDGGCVRCKNREAYSAGVGYDVCICVHAEQNAVITAARFGVPIESAVVYSTLRPCFDCTKALLQVKVRAIYYIHDWQHPIGTLHEQYLLAQEKVPGGVHKLDVDDPDAVWANGGQQT